VTRTAPDDGSRGDRDGIGPISATPPTDPTVLAEQQVIGGAASDPEALQKPLPDTGKPSGAPDGVTRRSILADLTPLRISPDYRRLWTGDTVSRLGQAMTQLAVSLQVYDITGSSFSVGLVGLFALVPLVVFGLYGGAIADTVDRRRLGLYSAWGLCLLSVTLSVGAFAGVAQVWFLYAIVALQAVCAALNGPARQSMVPRLIPVEQLPAANALSSLTMTSGTTFGPMLGGVVVGWWGYQAAYLVDAIAFTGSLYAMWRLPAMRPESGTHGSGAASASGVPGASGAAGAPAPQKRASVADGLRFLATRPNLRMTFFSDMAAMILASPKALFPAIAVLWYGGDAKTVGLLAAAPAVGALTGSVFSGWLGRVHRHGLAILLAVAGWGVAVAVFGLTRNLLLGLVFLALAGCADQISMVMRSTMLQAATPDALRGRLQGVFVIVVAGGPRLGDFLAGSVGDLAGPAVAITGGGVLCVLAVVVLGSVWRGFLRYDARAPEA
jgi:MFS family permease